MYIYIYIYIYIHISAHVLWGDLVTSRALYARAPVLGVFLCFCDIQTVPAIHRKVGS